MAEDTGDCQIGFFGLFGLTKLQAFALDEPLRLLYFGFSASSAC